MAIDIETTEPVKVNTAKSKVERFFDMYAARFGALTEKDGLDEWRRIAEPEGYDEQAMHTALDFIAGKLGENTHSKKPRIAWVKAEYNKARASMDKSSGKADRHDSFSCKSCAGTGYMVGIRVKKPIGNAYANQCVNLNELFRDIRRIDSAIPKDCPAYVVNMPCHCFKGASIWEKVFPASAGHQRQDIEQGKEMSSLCLPATLANISDVENLLRWRAI